ncbi:hypothetical protein BH23CHL8_BH23CHL8_01310 [soil metagenome]
MAAAAATCMEAAAAAFEEGRGGSDAGLIARARALVEEVLPAAAASVAGSSLSASLGARQEAELHLATARAHAERVAGRASPAHWAELAGAWEKLGLPYQRARALWWQGLAILASAPDDQREPARAAAREPLATAYQLARDLPALPLLREILDLSTRARVTLPVGEVGSRGERPRELVAVGPGPLAADASATSVHPGGADGTDGSRETEAGPHPRLTSPAAHRHVAVPVTMGPASGGPTPSSVAAEIARTIEERLVASLRRAPTDAYGLSPREIEVLNILAEGRTDRDIAARLFISQRTVHVHVRRILAKLGVASRTEATGMAIRQGLVSAEVTPVRARLAPPDDVASRA